MGTEPGSEVRPTTHSNVLIKLSAILPPELVDDSLEVVNSSIGIIALYSGRIVFVDYILVTFGMVWLDLRFRTTTFVAVIEPCEIR
jgi:hypothetical protein